MLILAGTIALGCGPQSSTPVAATHAVTAAAAGGSIDVEYVQPERLKATPAHPVKRAFPAKFVCGEAGPEDWHVPGSYRTVINILNMSNIVTHVQWFFTTFEQGAIPGATSEIQGRESIAMPCDFILRQLASAGLDVGGVTEGFVLLEAEQGELAPDKSVQVSVVYSFLHKQRHDQPDLVPVDKGSTFCTIDGGGLVVTIGNIGDVPSAASTARIAITGGQTVDRPTAALDPGHEDKLDPVPLPNTEGRIVFTITADHPKQVAESNELNNVAMGSCQIVL
jgi:hypothetical protein